LTQLELNTNELAKARQQSAHRTILRKSNPHGHPTWCTLVASSPSLSKDRRVTTKVKRGGEKKLHERRTDPLLRYLWHSRNADEHTLQQITEMKEASAKKVEPTQSDVDELNRAMANEKRPFVPLGLIEVVWAHIKMLDVTDRGITYPAPESHLGTQITDTSPANIVNLSLAFFDSMIAEAAQLT
jgi:hypothetical protein